MVHLDNISYSYKKNRPVFNNLNLDLQPGLIYGLLGKNGAGKSTLMKHISGLLYPQQGTATVFGYNAADRLPIVLEDIYVVPEEFKLPSLSIDRYVATHSVFYSKFSKEQFDAYIREFDLPADSKLNALSYGQKKIFLLSFGLATNARVLILDEPTNGLDIPSKSKFRKIVASALTEEQMIIISTHQVRDLENLIDQVVVLDGGKIVFNHNIAEISEHLTFEPDLRGYAKEDILYSEEVAGRQAGIVRNFGKDSRVDMELLFNGITRSALTLQPRTEKQY
jgi:ABC-2 type transport system ATP-binding protein